jgi:ribosomal protein S12 methylthiotransferase accessory factor YcaO
VSVVGCDSLLMDCPLDTDLIVLCFTFWNKARSQVMQGTLACFESHGCKPGATAALAHCYLESAHQACIEDHTDCTELAGTCDELTKANCEAALAPFHDSIREKTLTCAREAFAQPSGSEASCFHSFETCLTKVTSPITL